MSGLPACPQCSSAFAYLDRELLVCPECGHEWSPVGDSQTQEEEAVVRDAHGTPLADGDSVIVIKDLRVRGSSTVVKVGTRVKDIRLVEGDHDIDCRVDGIGPMQLKSEFVRKG